MTVAAGIRARRMCKTRVAPCPIYQGAAIFYLAFLHRPKKGLFLLFTLVGAVIEWRRARPEQPRSVY